MIFSSTIFLFGFLPCVLLCYFVIPQRLKNVFLLIASLFFYAWGELSYTLLMIISIFWNYLLGRVIDKSEGGKKVALIIGVGCNLLLLGYFKYASFIVENVNTLLVSCKAAPFHLDPIHLPLGISFFTFQAISYLVDVYRRETQSQKNIITLGLYISMFPQLIAGPIVRYSSVAKQLVSRTTSSVQMEAGVMRFVFGLAKKLLLANPLGEVADSIFALPPEQLPAMLVWTAIVAFSLQIYFDFSGYSDMAIGLGRMFGFTFPENFNYPYIARSLRSFWKRWHMSLTGWLRDYLYIPLGGSRVSGPHVILNLFIVFLLCGWWHGASWNFLIWGAWHGCFLALERGRLGLVLNRTPSLVQHLYVLLVVLVGWVFFRADTIPQAFIILKALAGFQGFTHSLYPIQFYISGEAIAAGIIGIVFTTPVFQQLTQWKSVDLRGFGYRLTMLSLLLFASFMKISSGTYNPFLYFRF